MILVHLKDGFIFFKCEESCWCVELEKEEKIHDVFNLS